MYRLLTMVRFRRGSGWRAVRVGGVVLVLLCVWVALSPTTQQHSHTNTRSADDGSMMDDDDVVVGDDDVGIPAPMTLSESGVDAAIYLSRPHPLHEPAPQVKEAWNGSVKGEGEGSHINPLDNLPSIGTGPKLHRNQPFFNKNNNNKRIIVPEDYGEYGLPFEVDEETVEGKGIDDEDNVALEEKEEYKDNNDGVVYSDDKKHDDQNNNNNIDGNVKAQMKEDEEKEDDDDDDDNDDDNAALEEDEYKYDEERVDGDDKIMMNAMNNNNNNAAIEKGQKYHEDQKADDVKKDDDGDNVAVEEVDNLEDRKKMEDDALMLEDVGGVAMRTGRKIKTKGKQMTIIHKEGQDEEGAGETKKDKAAEKEGVVNPRERIKENVIGMVDGEGLDIHHREVQEEEGVGGVVGVKDREHQKKKSLKFILDAEEEEKQRGIKVSKRGSEAARKLNQIQDVMSGKEGHKAKVVKKKISGNVDPNFVRNVNTVVKESDVHRKVHPITRKVNKINSEVGLSGKFGKLFGVVGGVGERERVRERGKVEGIGERERGRVEGIGERERGRVEGIGERERGRVEGIGERGVNGVGERGGHHTVTDDTEATTRVMAARMSRVKEVCGKYGLGPNATPGTKQTFKYPPTPTYEVFYIDRVDGLAWCPIYKAASTSWLYTFLALGGISESYVHNTHGQVSDVARAVWPPLEYHEAEQAMDSCLKFIIVRHPFERLVSAFRDKLENTNVGKEHGVDHYHRKYGRKIVARYRKGGENAAPPANRYSQDMDDRTIPRPKGIEPTFPEFVRYLIDIDLLQYSDDHWMPYYLHCTPCLIDYDIIAKFETLDRDQDYVMHRAGLQGRVKPFWKHLTKGRKTADTVKKYFATITKSELIKLYGKYRLDFELFDYSIDEYLDYVRNEET
ncbi:hypothetical protein Pmani_002670 [Petrolisthes manimaculis]|uniref:Carbohydrate sulfotransferase n=1 Tax=Petrolisthes manimaculis TaxID=1843537 RepID=A0AAE1UJ65_9EUCA|nr:hypothetical protein Pmani_002670 [Petrolisthes manimaculis]